MLEGSILEPTPVYRFPLVILNCHDGVVSTLIAYNAHQFAVMFPRLLFRASEGEELRIIEGPFRTGTAAPAKGKTVYHIKDKLVLQDHLREYPEPRPLSEYELGLARKAKIRAPNKSRPR